MAENEDEHVFIPPPPHIKTYCVGGKLGFGSFSEVYVATHDKTKVQYAMKVFPKSNLRTQGDIDRFQREIDSMAYLHYDNLISLHDFFWDENNFYLIMDLCSGGELFQFIVENQRLNEPIAALLFKQIAGAVAFCHSYGVAHRDLKPENILFTQFPIIKVTDFGLCGYISKERLMKTFCGSPCYCAPECLCRVQYDGRLSDIWSLGVILYAMVTGEHPWSVMNTSLMLRQIMKATYTIPDYVSAECRDLISSLLKVKPQDRLPMEKIINHPWIKFSEWSLVSLPSSLDTALNTMRMEQPMTLEQISSSSSRSSHRSDHGIISPFDDDYQNELKDEELPISLGTLVNSVDRKIRHFSTSMDRFPIENNNVQQPTRSRFIARSNSQMKFRKGLLCIPQVHPTNLMMSIKEEGC
ncbi:AGC family protein kinase [Tritrichomonas foetus]|uniref:AGC family protein kinase n=1 Tax=Tritrichomonas foetus TaxID=1144522 RepID=A0A1J4J8T3_9EUKA|nr:AGC family protein kinase [Tritrichomonas foetus]|eukprot:OHS94655.1 AGC family protein kinase [Tritrichomonas foetus]